jgi:hypothetical protein
MYSKKNQSVKHVKTSVAAPTIIRSLKYSRIPSFRFKSAPAARDALHNTHIEKMHIPMPINDSTQSM